MTVDDWKKKYEETRPRYIQLCEKLVNLLKELLYVNGIQATLESRVKELSSFEGKIGRKGYEDPLSQMTDIVGIRIIVRTLDEVSRVESIIKSELSIDDANSVSKLSQLDPDRFGYLSEHYVVKVSSPRAELLEWRSVSELPSEIQVRTIVQHAWAAVQHSLDYKTACDIPHDLRRRLFRISALFELADQELNSVSRDANSLFESYQEQISQNRSAPIELNSESIRAYLTSSEEVAYWADVIKSFGQDISAPGLISRDLEMAREAGITDIESLDSLLSGSRGWGEDYLKEFYLNSYGSLPTKGSTDLNGVVTLLLIGNYLDIFTDTELNGRWGFGKPERATRPARKINPRFENEKA
ncbi:GTP pyrophosphokinase [Shewanella baltica]|uniref:GTP pyrophosphokinase n=1 Tax=Shewanella baltica TaxID=62322 RepID=UPI000DFD0111|nr:hypothetical protein [Shewanella baltica]SUI63907.1 GTP pyrophosphokinase ywaC [Shewanella baltica]